MNIREELNPFRLHTLWFDSEILLQIEDDERKLTVTKSKQSTKAKSKAVVLWEGEPEDFATEFNGEVGFGQIDYRIALKNLVYSLKD